MIISWSIPALALTTNTITFTGTPAYIAISTSPNTFTWNSIAGSSKILVNTTYYTNPLGDTTAPAGANVVDGECTFTTTNTSNVGIDLTFNMPNYAGGDASTNSNTGGNGANTFGAYAWYSGLAYANKVIAKNAGSGHLIENLTALTNLKWGCEMTTQSGAWTSATAMTSAATLAAVTH